VTPKGHILLDTLEQEYVPVIEKSVADLGFKFSDIKIILGNHAHSDHMAGNALVKQLTGGEIDVMEGDVAAMQCKPYCYSDPTRTPDGRPHPIDRVLHDGDEISLGGTTLVAHLTAGHTDGCTTFTTTVVEAGKPYHVVFACSLRSPATITPRIAYEFGRTFQVVRDLPCDVYLGDHPSFYDMHTKYAKLKPGAPNPFIDAETCHREIDFEEASFNAILAEQEEDPPVVQP
jgi:metallo-beta-lactamase class B